MCVAAHGVDASMGAWCSSSRAVREADRHSTKETTMNTRRIAAAALAAASVAGIAQASPAGAITFSPPDDNVLVTNVFDGTVAGTASWTLNTDANTVFSRVRGTVAYQNLLNDGCTRVVVRWLNAAGSQVASATTGTTCRSNGAGLPALRSFDVNRTRSDIARVRVDLQFNDSPNGLGTWNRVARGTFAP
jgi:hypothetical protein